MKRWGGSSIGSIAIGQEVAVTPVQLVTMVSTIANGGVYLPPHVLFPNQLDPTTPIKSQPRSRRRPFKPGERPAQSAAHRRPSRDSTLTAAQMRKMMEGVVLFGTGKPAQLNGYSSGGKTGTAQKIDPATHTLFEDHAHRLIRGLCAGQQSGDRRRHRYGSPKGAYYGASVSAPVFAEVAQQVLEYLGVPHDIDLRPLAAIKIREARHRGRRRAE